MPFIKRLSPLLFLLNNILVKMYSSSNCWVKNSLLLVMFSILPPSSLGQILPSDYFSPRIRISASLSMLSIFSAQYTLLSLLESVSRRLSCRAVKKSSSPKPGKIEMSLFTRSFRRGTKHLLQYRPSILWPSLETFKINFKSFLYSFHIPSVSSLFY